MLALRKSAQSRVAGLGCQTAGTRLTRDCMLARMKPQEPAVLTRGRWVQGLVCLQLDCTRRACPPVPGCCALLSHLFLTPLQS